MYSTIGAALSQCAAGDTVVVEDGVYSGEGNTNLTMPPVNVVLLSRHGPGSCQIDCQDEGNWLFLNDGQTQSTVIEGFRVLHGVGDMGGAMKIQWASPTVRGCEFTENHGLGGGAVLTLSEDGLFEDCVFHGNGGDAEFGGAVWATGGRVTFRRCLFDHNTAVWGGAFFGSAMDAIFESCTFHGNFATRKGGAICYPGGYQQGLNMQYSIVWGNGSDDSAPEIYSPSAWIEPLCCDMNRAGIVGVDWTFGSCIDADPLFCDAADWSDPWHANDYRLRSDSPCRAVASPCGQLVGVLDEGCTAPDTAGACCVGPDCYTWTEAQCVAAGGQFVGEWVPCEAGTCESTPIERTTWGKIKVRYRSE